MVLTVEQKLEIAAAELDQLSKDVVAAKAGADDVMDKQNATLREHEARLAEVEKDARDFERDVEGETDKLTGRLLVKNLVKWMDMRLRARETLVEKLRLKNTGLRTSTRKLEAQLKQKEEMGDVLHYIDFHQLQIENKQYLARIEERNAQLLQLKVSTGATVQNLNMLKDSLSKLQGEVDWRKKEIKSRTELRGRLTTELRSVRRTVQADQSVLKSLSEQVQAGSDLPTVMDYVTIRGGDETGQKQVESWRRKVEIARMAVARAKTALSAARTEAALAAADPMDAWRKSSTLHASALSSLSAGPAAHAAREALSSANSSFVRTAWGTRDARGVYRGSNLSRGGLTSRPPTMS